MNTPGPWTAGLDMPEVANNDPDPRLIWSNSMCIGSAKSIWISQQEQKDNAKLMAVSLDLAACLQGLLVAWPDPSLPIDPLVAKEFHADAKAALAKAG
jgi:hypothetical protein